jgi:hypothetical protein
MAVSVMATTAAIMRMPMKRAVDVEHDKVHGGGSLTRLKLSHGSGERNRRLVKAQLATLDIEENDAV